MITIGKSRLESVFKRLKRLLQPIQKQKHLFLPTLIITELPMISEEIIELAHQHHIPVLVDEAHGAHFISAILFLLQPYS